MTQSVNDRFGFIDWFVKVEMDDGKVAWSTGPYSWGIVVPAVGSFNRKTRLAMEQSDKMVECDACGEKIPELATVCSYCKATQVEWIDAKVA